MEVAKDYINSAFAGDGRQRFEWMHLLADGTLMPAEIDLVRVPYGGDYVVVAFVRDLREYKRIMGELEDALEEATRANKSKSSFLANMSHEMRTPLNAILGMSELVLGANLTSEVHSNIEKIYAAGSMLLSTVNDILDISKIEAGKFEIITGDYDVPSTINDTVTQNIMRIGEKPIKFVLDVQGDLPARLHGDELRVKQVLNNLLSNAMKYTAQGTVELSIRCERDGPDIWVTARVADTGVGIKPEDLGKLFVDYSQFDKKVNHRIEGTGLGLPITKMVLGLMDGTIGIESEHGKGSVFTARFRQGFVGDETIGPQVAESLKGFHFSDTKRTSGMRFVRSKLPYARVLVVDDIETNLEVAKGLMKPYEMQVDCVTSGQQAVNAIRKGSAKYDAVFMDHMMPEMDGITATRLIRMDIGTEYAKKIPIIALTANAIVGNEKMFLDSGFQDFISKPIDLMRLDGVIKRWVRSPDHERLMAEFMANAPAGYGREQDQGGDHHQLANKAIDGIDIEKGIERFGSEDVYLKILRSYIDTTQSLLGQLHLVDRDTLEDYAIRVHGIKGSSRGIGAFNVGDIAEALEHAAKAGDMDFISKNNKSLINAAGLLILNIQETLDEAALRSGKPKKQRPDGDLLARLMEACAGYDMDGVDDVMSKIDAFDYDGDDGLAAWLRENVAITNFAQIKDRLSAMLAK
jgi:signal transduction histidine kinase/CheY-like chemotaxis protein